MRAVVIAAVCCALLGADDGHRLKLAPYLPSGTAENGLVLKVSLDGGKPLRLVFDTGASGVTISAKAAGMLELVSEALIGGFGAQYARTAHIGIARRLEVGGVRIENCVVRVVDSNFVPGADGVIGADVFGDFQVRLDAWSHTLELLPLRDEPSSIETVRIGHLLAIRTTVEQFKDGLFVIDTGAAHTAIAPDMIRGAKQPVATAYRGAQGQVQPLGSASNVHLQVAGGPALTAPNVLALDLRTMSQKEGARITGLLGYSTLSRVILTLDYRHSRVGLERR